MVMQICTVTVRDRMARRESSLQPKRRDAGAGGHRPASPPEPHGEAGSAIHTLTA